MKIVIAGGTGFLGRQLGDRLISAGHDVVILTRHPQPTPAVRQVGWDAATVGDWAAELESADQVAVVNLAGEQVGRRPNRRNIATLRDSRVDATRALVAASRQLERPVAHWLQASTTAIWSDAGETAIDESSPVPHGGLPQMTGVARPWEAALIGANTERFSVLRISIVLAAGCPVWDRLTALTKFGLGGTMGSGRQWISWIHLDDWLRVADVALGLDPDITVPDGPLIAASPNPVRNRELMSLLRKTFHRPGVPAPTPLARVGGFLLRTDPALGLTGRHATSTVLADAGFHYHHPELAGAVCAITGD